MEMWNFGRRALGIGLAAFLLSGCGASQVPASLSGATGASRLKHNTSSRDLVYANSEPGIVAIATYPELKAATTFDLPRRGSSSAYSFGLCSDTSGNVFITADYFGPYVGNIYEYRHGATSPSATLSVAQGYEAFDCAYDARSGNLAVVDYDHATESGGISIFANEEGQPVVYTVSNMGEPLYAGYDGDGNLFVSGEGPSGCAFAELPKGAGSFLDISLPYGIGCSGRIQWDGKHITMENAVNHVIYQLSISGSSGSIAGTTALNDVTPRAMGESWLDSSGSRVVVPNGHSDRTLGDYKYPAGGKPIKVGRHMHVKFLESATISVGS